LNMESADLLITNGVVVTQNKTRSIIYDGAIAIKGNQIIGVGQTSDLLARYRPVERLTVYGNAIFPGLVNVHTHLFQTGVKGLGEDMAVQDWVRVVTAPTAAHINPEEAYLFAATGCLEHIRCGTTTLVDMSYAVPEFEIHEAYIHAILDSGLRGRYSSIISDYGDFGLPPEILKPIDTFLDETGRLQSKYPISDQMGIWLAIGAPWVATDDAIRRTRAFATDTNTFLTMHLNENEVDNELIQERHGMDAIEYLEDIGFLGPDFLAIHCVVMTPQEIAQLARYDVKVAYNPVSNMYLGSGIPPITALARAGVTVGMGVDGAGSNNSLDMIETLKIGALLQKVGQRNASVIDAQTMLDWATMGGATVLGMEDKIGSLEPGKKADMFVLALNSPKIVPVHDPVTTLVYSAGEENVLHTIANGKFVMKDKEIKSLNETETLQACQRNALSLANRSGANKKLSRTWPLL
jgi:5-methylthioadenosine/S-adenosylhomocysteine deaminase